MWQESRKQYVVTVSPQPENGLLLVHFSESAAAKSSAAASTEKNDDNVAATQGHMSVALRIFFTSFRVLQLSGKPKQPKEAAGHFAENEDGAGDQEEEEEANEDENEHLGEALPCSSSNCLPKKLCIDALTEVRRAVWLQVHPCPPALDPMYTLIHHPALNRCTEWLWAVLSNHPVACVLVNVVRVVRHLMLNGVPDQWGQLSEYVSPDPFPSASSVSSVAYML
ncbi:unnamed protein product [Dibothriocephalus latus]|uniref:Uncharacterized protein n=1 Tax=Dibothriocephalus latus TaxID=60516 RepID=A0A3P7M077_DIBLA|nr:unnamed protein product [Dibothriocephalus latus]